MEYSLPKPTIVNRQTVASRQRPTYETPVYEVLKDPGFGDEQGARDWAKKFVTDLMEKEEDHSLMISSLAGTGKTFTTNCIIERLTKKEIPFLALAPTHVASHLLGGVDDDGKHIGRTIHSAFSVMKNGNLSSFAKYKVIIVDEFSMVSEMHWAALIKLKRQYPNIRIVLVGNWAQLEPVNSRSSDFDFENANCIHELVNGRKLVLTKCRRADEGGQELFKQYRYLAEDKYDKFDLDKFKEKECDLSIAYYNSTVHRVNKSWMKHYQPEDSLIVRASTRARNMFKCQDIILYDGLPLMACQTRESEGFFNCETWKVASWDVKKTRLVSDDELPEKRYCEIDTEELADIFRPAYCFTSHKAQGSTIRRPYTVYDW
ncbi:MAG: AAA family ATPase, partial [Candidatus Pacebacteria bacterium]|nr:AAA family ATPase [Candidatus Paceibacterota bacterium]